LNVRRCAVLCAAGIAHQPSRSRCTCKLRVNSWIILYTLLRIRNIHYLDSHLWRVQHQKAEPSCVTEVGRQKVSLLNPSIAIGLEPLASDTFGRESLSPHEGAIGTSMEHDIVILSDSTDLSDSTERDDDDSTSSSLDSEAVAVEFANEAGPSNVVAHPNQRLGRASFNLLNLPHDYLETFILHHAPVSALPGLRASCRELKLLADLRLTSLTLPYEDLVRHSFWRTCALTRATTLVLNFPGELPAATSAAGAIAANPAPQPLSALLPPVLFTGLRRHLPALQSLTLHDVHFPKASASSSSSRSKASSSTIEHPLDFSGLSKLELKGRFVPSEYGNPGAGNAATSWRGSGLNPFPCGLGPSLVRAAASLTSLRLSYMTFAGREGDVLGQLTGLRELAIEFCNNHTSHGLTGLSRLTRLTRLTYADIHYRAGIPNEMVGLSALTQLAEVNLRRSDFYPNEVAAWAAWGPSLTSLEISSVWQMTLDAVPQLWPHLSRLTTLRLPDHTLDPGMLRTMIRHLPALTAATFNWIDLWDSMDDTEDEEDEGEAEGGGGGADNGNGGGGGINIDDGGGAGGGAAAAAVAEEIVGGLRRREGQLSHTALRSLQLIAPRPGDVCDRSLLAFLPGLTELRCGDDTTHSSDERAYDLTDDFARCCIHLLLPAPSPGAGVGGTVGAGHALRVLVMPCSWLQKVPIAHLPSLEVLRLLPVHPSSVVEGTEGAEARNRCEWRTSYFAGSSYLSNPNVRQLEVPDDLDLAELLRFYPAVRHVTISGSYGNALLGLVAAA
ncbi:hypothetical protein Agub_g8387, partial [Astrephomene gubernaculifera]